MGARPQGPLVVRLAHRGGRQLPDPLPRPQREGCDCPGHPGPERGGGRTRLLLAERVRRQSAAQRARLEQRHRRERGVHHALPRPADRRGPAGRTREHHLGRHRVVRRRHHALLRHGRRAAASVLRVAASTGHPPIRRREGLRGGRRAVLRLRRSHPQPGMDRRRHVEPHEHGGPPRAGRSSGHAGGAGTAARGGPRVLARPLGRPMGRAHESRRRRLPGRVRPSRSARRVDRPRAPRAGPACAVRRAIRGASRAARVARRAASAAGAVPRRHRTSGARARRTPRRRIGEQPRVGRRLAAVPRPVLDDAGLPVRGGRPDGGSHPAEANTGAGHRSRPLQVGTAVGHGARRCPSAHRRRAPPRHRRRRLRATGGLRLWQLRVERAAVLLRRSALVARPRRRVGAGPPAVGVANSAVRGISTASSATSATRSPTRSPASSTSSTRGGVEPTVSPSGVAAPAVCSSGPASPCVRSCSAPRSPRCPSSTW